jgi:hypothetical protein
MQSTSFTNTSVMTDKTLADRRNCNRSGIVQLTLLGATSPEFGQPDLLYAVTRRRPDANIRNVIQMSASILSSSRVVFLGMLRKFALLLDPRKAQLCYTGESDLLLRVKFWNDLVLSDTDSIVVATAFPSLVQCLRSEDAASVAELNSMFEDPLSPLHQAGRLKSEGWYTAGLFRSAKSYFLSGKVDVRRMRSVPRRVQQSLSASHFGQDSAKNTSVFRTKSLRPTLGLQVAVLEESRRISHSLNFKMVSIVSSPRQSHTQSFPDALFQDPVHTVPLP